MITLTNSGAAQTDYAVKISLTYSTNMNADFSDLRFTNSGGTNLDFWIEKSTASTSATVWVEVDSLAGTSTTEIYMYYGNASATSASNGENTFPFFDDFSSGTIDPSKWTTNAPTVFTVSGGEMIVSSNTGGWSKTIYTTNSFSRSDLVAESDYRWDSNNSGYDALMLGWHDDSIGASYTNLVYGYYNPGYYSGNCTTCFVLVYEDGTGRGIKTGSWIQSQEYAVRVFMKASGGATYEQSTDGGDTWTTSYDTTYSTESDLRPGIAQHTGTHAFDNYRVRQWMTTEPTTSFASEENRYAASGTLTSNIISTAAPGSAWSDLIYSKNSFGTVTVKLRSGTDSSLSDATAFSACTGITSGTDMTGTSCVSDGDRYIQYEVTFSTSTADTPILQDIAFDYDPLTIAANAGPNRV